MDRKTFLAILKFARSRGFEGKTFEQFKGWAEQPETNLGVFDFGDGKTYTLDDVKAAWDSKAVKTVTVSIGADAGEDVVVQDASAQTEELDEEEDMKEMDEDEEIAKSAARRKKFRESQAKFEGIKRVHAPRIMTSKNGHDSALNRRKSMYDRAVKDGLSFMGQRPVFNSSDEAEYAGAMIRLVATKDGTRRYSQLENDRAIVKTAGSTLDNSWAGTLIVSQVAPEIIDLLHTYGAARQLAGVTNMPDGKFDTKRKTGDMAFGYVDEGDTIPQTNPAHDNVSLNARKVAGIGLVNNEMLNDSAFDIGDIVTKSSASGMAKFEDEEYFLGSYGTHGGLVGNSDSDSTYDAALSSGWEDYTIAKLTAWKGKVPVEAIRDGSVMIACSNAFKESVLNRFALGAAGNTGADVVRGFNMPTWDGIPIVVTEVLPSTYSADQISAYIGSFKRGTKIGVVEGSEEIDSTSDRYWDTDQFAWRIKERVAFNFHDVGGTSSEVIALKD